MSILALIIAVGLGILSGFWLEEVGISTSGSIIIAVPVAYGWCKIVSRTCRV